MRTFGLLIMLTGPLVLVGLIALAIWAVLHFSGSGGSNEPPELG